MKSLFPVALLATASCVMPSDIADLKRVQADYAHATAEDIRKLELGVITREEYDRRQAELIASHDKTVEAIEQRVEDRTEAAVAAATPLPITGNPALDLLLSLGGTALATAAGVNRMRDKRRVQRGEPVQPAGGAA